MQRYRVRDGAVLPHQGAVLPAGSVVELPRHVAEDVAVRDVIVPIDAVGQVITLPPYDAELDRVRPHERITILKDRMLRLTEEIRTEEAGQIVAATEAPKDPPVRRRNAPAAEET